MATPKIIPYTVKLRSVVPEKTFSKPPVVYTNDLRSAEFQFKITDMDASELLTATAKTMLYMRDGSFFQNPSTDVSRVGNVFSYLLKENEGNHAGIAKIQLVVYFNEGLANEQNFPTQLYEFEIINGLETKVAQEVMIYDWTTLTRDARAYIDQFVADEMLRDAEFDNNEFDRNVAFAGSQDARALAFGTEQTNRGTAFTAEQNERTTAFNESESGRTTAETGRVTAESNRVTAESGRVTKESQRVTAESSRVTAEGNRVTAESGRVTAESGRVTAETDRAAAFTAFNTRLTAEETATANNKVSAVKGKTFADVDARLEDVEFDTTLMATNLILDGNLEVDYPRWFLTGATKATISTEQAKSGTKSIKLESVNASSVAYQESNANANDLIYAGFWARIASFVDASPADNVCGFSDAGAYTNVVEYKLNNKNLNVWQYKSVIHKAPGNFRFYVGTTSGVTRLLYVDDIILINLTATFGKGNEPTAEQMDAILAKFPNSWFDGTKNLFRANATLNKLMAVDARTEFEAKNEVANGDFSNGTTGWSASNSTLSTANNTLSVTSDGTASNPRVNQVAIDMNRKYYVRLKYRVTNPNCLTMMAYIGIDNIYLSSINSPVENQWYTPSGILTSFGLGKRAFFISHAYSDAATALGKVMEVQYVQAIDLTAAFGAGKEPTLAEMDRLMARYPNSWFDGVKPIQTIESLYQEKANKVQEAWITPTLLNGWTNYGTDVLKMYKDEFGIVHIRGRVRGGLAFNPIITLPAGYRPAQGKYASNVASIGAILASTRKIFMLAAQGGTDNRLFIFDGLSSDWTHAESFLAIDISYRAEA